MTKKQLKEKLEFIAKNMNRDPEAAHGRADDALLEYINDKDITNAFSNVNKWYA